MRCLAIGSGLIAIVALLLILISLPRQVSQIREKQAEFLEPIRRTDAIVAQSGTLPSEATLATWQKELHLRGNVTVRWAQAEQADHAEAPRDGGFVLAIWQGERREEYNSSTKTFSTSVKSEIVMSLAASLILGAWMFFSFHFAFSHRKACVTPADR